MNFKKELVLAFALLNLISISHAMQPAASSQQAKSVITLPSAQVLSQRLRQIGLDHYLEKSRIDQQLGGQKKYPMGVALAVELSLHDYVKGTPMPMLSTMMQMRKPEIIETILQDHPEAIAELKEVGLLPKSNM